MDFWSITVTFYIYEFHKNHPLVPSYMLKHKDSVKCSHCGLIKGTVHSNLCPLLPPLGSPGPVWALGTGLVVTGASEDADCSQIKHWVCFTCRPAAARLRFRPAGPQPLGFGSDPQARSRSASVQTRRPAAASLLFDLNNEDINLTGPSVSGPQTSRITQNFLPLRLFYNCLFLKFSLNVSCLFRLSLVFHSVFTHRNTWLKSEHTRQNSHLAAQRFILHQENWFSHSTVVLINTLISLSGCETGPNANDSFKVFVAEGKTASPLSALIISLITSESSLSSVLCFETWEHVEYVVFSRPCLLKEESRQWRRATCLFQFTRHYSFETRFIQFLLLLCMWG